MKSPKIRGPRDKHPSGRAINRCNDRRWGDGYANRDEPKTLRLRRDHGVTAIGFTANLTCDYDDE